MGRLLPILNGDVVDRSLPIHQPVRDSFFGWFFSWFGSFPSPRHSLSYRRMDT